MPSHGKAPEPRLAHWPLLVSGTRLGVCGAVRGGGAMHASVQFDLQHEQSSPSGRWPSVRGE